MKKWISLIRISIIIPKYQNALNNAENIQEQKKIKKSKRNVFVNATNSVCTVSIHKFKYSYRKEHNSFIKNFESDSD